MRILVTGANGFIGRGLVGHLEDAGHVVIAASRSRIPETGSIRWCPVGDLNQPFDWGPVLDGIDSVVHLAAIAHTASNAEEYDRVNHQSTVRLATDAAKACVGHFVFVSSISAQTGPSSRTVLTEADDPRPTTPYGLSKLTAENALKRIGIPLTILRPVVVDGENAKGNIRTLHRIAALPAPLPIGGISAKRSILSAVNFNAAVTTVLGNPRAFSQTFIVANPAPLTIGEIVSDFRQRRGRKANIFTVPEPALKMALSTVGLRRFWGRLGDPLVASPRKLLSFGWQPD